VDKNLKRDWALAEEVEQWTKEKDGSKLQMRNVWVNGTSHLHRKAVGSRSIHRGSILRWKIGHSRFWENNSHIHRNHQIHRLLNPNSRSRRFRLGGRAQSPCSSFRGYSIVDIRIKILRLYDVALCQNFARNLVFLRQKKKPMVGQLTEI